MSKSPKKLSAVAAVAGLLATLFVAQASPASAETDSAYASRFYDMSVERTFTEANQVTFYAGELISLSFNASVNSTGTGLATDAAIQFDSGFTVASGTVSYPYISGNMNVNYGGSDHSAPISNADPVSVSATGPVNTTTVYWHYNATASTDVTITFNPVIKHGGIAYIPDTHFLNFSRDAYVSVRSMGGAAPSYTAHSNDDQIMVMPLGVCVNTTGVDTGTTLTLTSDILGGSSHVGTSTPQWQLYGSNGMPVMGVGNTAMAATFDKPVMTSGQYIRVSSTLVFDSPVSGTLYKLGDFKITQASAPSSNLITSCGTSVGTAAAATVTVLNGHTYVTTPITMGDDAAAQYWQYSCALYASTDTSHSTVIGGGSGFPMGMPSSTAVVNCTVRDVPTGTYSVGFRAVSPGMSFSAERFLPGTVTVAAASKVDPTFPTVASKVTKGKTIKVALSSTLGTASQGKNSQGLVTVVAPASATAKTYCTVAAVKTSGKITGYTIKGVKKHASNCKVKITITGNTQYNTKSKTVTVKVV